MTFQLSEPYVRPEFQNRHGAVAFNHGQPQRLVPVDGAQLTYNQLVEEALQDLAHGRISRAGYVRAVSTYRALTGCTESDAYIV